MSVPSKHPAVLSALVVAAAIGALSSCRKAPKGQAGPADTAAIAPPVAPDAAAAAADVAAPAADAAAAKETPADGAADPEAASTGLTKEGAPGAHDFSAMSRDELNRRAVRLDLPLFWRLDADGDGAVDPDEVAGLLFYPTEGRWVADGAFTPEFAAAYEKLKALAPGADPYAALPAPERDRRRAIDQELDQGYPTLVEGEFSGLSAPEKAFLARMLAAGRLIDELYAAHCGAAAVASLVPADDPASASAFRRNWGVRCVAPLTEGNPACSAAPGAPAQPVDAYPAALQKEDGFCQTLAARPDAETLLTPFTVVRENEDRSGLVAVPLTVAYAEKMKAVASELRAAADAIETVETEAALRTYLRAAADSFESNDWQPADEAWSRMNAENSAWYVRVAPDEVYWDPCAQHAGFHMTFARINDESLAWQAKLAPVQQDMEDALAARIGRPYAARTVTFHLPDFIDIVSNHGDDRDPMMATIGQSLPNWGPVANEGRGRTVVMSNLYTDEDSMRMARNRVLALFDPAFAAAFGDRQKPDVLGTILHEATHNLGPSHEYAVRGKKDDDLFGGPLASVMEELKAQTGALWFVRFLEDRGILGPDEARQSYAVNLAWCMGHISRGMYADGVPKAYSQLSAIQIGLLLELGAMRWDPEALAANGTDRGAFAVDFEKLPDAIDEMMRRVGRIKATGDRAAAEALVARFVDGDVVPQAVIRERVLRDPKNSFVYAVTY
ncbi:MAG: hypothetical protein HY907_14980 [Deltaproteobacteria bacterium]|nr:hypothetical protein [Deltaproteobacteria bacterium]